jgi:hypothetical protein
MSKLGEVFPDVPIIMDYSGYLYFRSDVLETRRKNDKIYFGMSCVIEPTYIGQVTEEIGV